MKMNKYIKDLKKIVDDKYITPAERYDNLIKYINCVYKFLKEEEGDKEADD